MCSNVLINLEELLNKTILLSHDAEIFTSHCTLLLHCAKYFQSSTEWKEQVVFQFCLPYLTKNNSHSIVNEILKSCCFDVLTEKLLEFSSAILMSHITALTKDSNKPDISIQKLVHVLQIVSDDNSSVKWEKIFEIFLDILSHNQLNEAEFAALNNFITKQLTASKTKLLWNCVMKVHQGHHHDRHLVIIASNIEHIANSDVVHEHELWMILQEGLADENSLSRKRSLFIFKWLLDLISRKGDFTLSATDDDTMPLIFWRSSDHDCLWQEWKAILLLLETLEEKQLHMIKPMLPSLNVLLKNFRQQERKLVNFEWFVTIFRRLLRHECKLLNRWVLKCILQLDLETFPLLSQMGFRFIFIDVMDSLKSIYMFTHANVFQNKPPELCVLLEGFFRSLQHNVKDKQFCFSQLLLLIADTTFCDLSLLYITKSFCKLHLVDEWCADDWETLNRFLLQKLPLLKVEYQQIIFQHMSEFYMNNSLCINIITAMKLICYGFQNALISYNDQCWTLWFLYLRSSELEVFNNDMEKYMALSCPTTMDSIKICVITFLVNTRDLNLDFFLLPLTDVANKLTTHPYLSSTKILLVFNFLEQLIACIEPSACHENCKPFLKMLTSYFPHVLNYFLLLKDNLLDINVHVIDACIKVVTRLVCLMKNTQQPDKTTELSPTCEHIQLDDAFSEKSGFFYKAYILRMVLNMKVGDWEQLARNVLELFRTDLSLLQSTTVQDSVCLTHDYFIKTKWLCLVELWNFEQSKKEIVTWKTFLIDEFYNDMDATSLNAQSSLLQFSRHLSFIYHDSPGAVVNLVTYLWKFVKGTKNDRHFWFVWDQCAAAIFHNSLVSTEDHSIINVLRECWNEIFELSQRKSRMLNIALNRFLKVCGNVNRTLCNYVDVFVKLGVFGPLLAKDVKPYETLISFINNNNDCYAVTPELHSVLHYNRQVKGSLVSFLLRVKMVIDIQQFYTLFFEALVEFEAGILMHRMCYYPNSTVHRQKIRVWQLALVLLDLLPASYDLSSLLDILHSRLRMDNQPSVRRYIEWCILRIYTARPSLIGTLWNHMESASEKKLASVVHVFSISIHLARLLDNVAFVEFTHHAVKLMLPWTQAQHMTSRILSQAALKVIWENIESRGLTHLRETYGVVEYCFSLSETNTSAVKHRNETLKNFFYISFDPVGHYSLESIFSGVLSRTEVDSDEHVHVLHFHAECKGNRLALYDVGTKSMNMQSAGGNPGEMDGLGEEGSQYDDVQKKLMPWNIPPPSDVQIQRAEMLRKNRSMTSQLVLCAVLLDKIPNLGGLCRTAEIFGVSSLAIASNRYVSDPAFKSLSVSAEKWVDIEQVLPIKLATYLSDMKADGYQIVGVEQTAKSKMVGEYKFPKKTVLVLGNEKSGIPVDIIQCLDECVEIPQVGIIRSLNVHISGAIMVWEYFKQHTPR